MRRTLQLSRHTMPMMLDICILTLFLATNYASAQFITTDQLNQIFIRKFSGNSLYDEYQDVPVGNAARVAQWCNPELPTVIYIHGWSEDINSSSVVTVMSAYIARADHNVLAVDWSSVSKSNYITVSFYASHVGKVLAHALDKMVNNHLNPATLHIVAHSMGAQIAGYIGENTGFNVTRITGNLAGMRSKGNVTILGLDPAGPGFNFIMGSLQSKHAAYVDMIHTDAGVYGTMQSSGHANFWPNGGARVQPGCPSVMLGSDEDFCSHHRSFYYYAESLSDERGFIGLNCDSNDKFKNARCDSNGIAVMGIAARSDVHGSYYLNTNASPPYAKGNNGIHSVRR